KNVTIRFQHGAQFGKVFDDAIMHDCKSWCDVGMGVTFNRLSMCGPARMSNTNCARKRLRSKAFFKVDQLAFSAPTRQLSILQSGNTCGIIATIFQPFQGIYQKRCNVIFTDDANNSTHRKLRYILTNCPWFTGSAQERQSLLLPGLFNHFDDSFAALIAAYFSRRIAARPSLFSCRARPNAKASSGTSVVTTLPDAT